VAENVLEKLLEKPALAGVPPVRRSEHQGQCAVFRHLRRVLPRYGRKAFAVPNGTKLGGSQAQRAATMRELKAEGLEPGVPDWQIPGRTPRGGFGGVVVEMKTARGRVSPEQWDWLLHYASIGWFAAVCRSEAEALNVCKAVGYE
jgi:hypothetical protein